MFEKLSYTVLRTPLRWLDTVPVGRVLNRFTADFNILDSRIAGNMGFAFYQCLELVGISLAGFLVSPYMIIFAALLMCIALYVALRFLYGAREVKRLESNAKSPVFEQFGSALAGVGTIRAFDKAEEYIERCVFFWPPGSRKFLSALEGMDSLPPFHNQNNSIVRTDVLSIGCTKRSIIMHWHSGTFGYSIDGWASD